MFCVVAIKDLKKLLLSSFTFCNATAKTVAATHPEMFIDVSSVFTGALSEEEIEPRALSGAFNFLACLVC